MSTISGVLRDPQQAHKWFSTTFQRLKPFLMAGEVFNIEVFQSKTRAQERLYHSVFKDFSKQLEAPAVGKTDAESWKRLMVDAFYRATKDDPEYSAAWKGRAPRIIPNLDGTGFVSVEIQTRRLTKGLAAGFITYLHAWGDEKGVVWSQTSLGQQAQDVPVSSRRTVVVA